MRNSKGKLLSLWIMAMRFTFVTHKNGDKNTGSGGIRTHASEETGALNQRLRPLGHATDLDKVCMGQYLNKNVYCRFFS